MMINHNHTLTALLFASIATVLAIGTTPALAQAFSDGFNDGDDAGWTRYDPISIATAGAASSTYSFPNGDSYRIQGVESPAPTQIGPARAGSFRADITQTDFVNTVDIVDWDDNLEQIFGLVARANQVGLGTTNAYSLVYNTTFDQFSVGRFDNEVDTEPVFVENDKDFVDITLDPTKDYRFVFSGVGTTLTGQLFDLNDLVNPLATVTATDSIYASGSVGLLTASAIGPGVNLTGADATFDNFTAAVPEPVSSALLVLGGLGLIGRRRRKCPSC